MHAAADHDEFHILHRKLWKPIDANFRRIPHCHQVADTGCRYGTLLIPQSKYRGGSLRDHAVNGIRIDAARAAGKPNLIEQITFSG